MTDKIDCQVDSGVNLDGQPFVSFALVPAPGSGKIALDPATARMISTWLLEAAEAADHDAMFFAWMSDQGFDKAQIASLISGFRTYRRQDDTESESRSTLDE